MTRSSPRQRVRIVALAMVVLLAAVCNGPARPSHPPVQAVDSAAERSMEVVTAEHTVRDFFTSLVEGRTLDAHALLASGPRSDMSVEQMEQAAAAVRQVEVRKLEPLQVFGERIILQATLDVTPNLVTPGEWTAGVNTRWIEVVHSRRGWRIAQIASAPIAASEHPPITQWTLVHILDPGLSLDVPHMWQMHPGRWAWSPPGRSVPVVEVRWHANSVDAYALRDAGQARVTRAAPVEMGWGRGMEYALEVPGAAGDTAVALYRLHFVVGSHDAVRTISVFGETRHREDVRALRLVLRRMLTSMEFATPSSLTAQRGGD